MAVQTKSLHITRGEYWQRVIAPRDRRTHWPAPCTTSSAFLQDINGAKITIPSSIQTDGSILLILDETATSALLEGEYFFQVSGDPYVPIYNLGGLVPPSTTRFRPVAQGTISVVTTDYQDFVGDYIQGPTLVQSDDDLNLRWVAGDPVSLSFSAQGANWTGSYVANIRVARDPASTLVGTFTATATFDGTNTNFVLTLSSGQSATILAGLYFWDLQQTGGVTRLRGTVTVDTQVTPP